MKITTRREWGAQAGDGNGSRPLPTSTAWLHHSVTRQLSASASVADEVAQMRAIENIGVQRFGAHYGFPYTFAVFPSGRVYEGHALNQRGAHTAGHNTDGIGIVFPGNYEQAKPTAAALEAAAQLLVQLKREGKIKRARLDGGHKDSTNAVRLAGPTACPGRNLYGADETINARAAALEQAKPKPTPPPSTGGSGSQVDQLGRYTVRSGDTLGGLASRFRTSVDALVLLNGISNPDRIDVGDVLYTRWVVGPGQSLSIIAREAGTSVDQLVRLNGIRNPDMINVGQLLRLP